MMYRALGGVALALGGIFVIITLLVLLPFLSNYNISLLVLAAVFGVIAYVLVAIGWQLLHPPKPEQTSSGEVEEASSSREPTPAQANEDIGATSEIPSPVPPVSIESDTLLPSVSGSMDSAGRRRRSSVDRLSRYRSVSSLTARQ